MMFENRLKISVVALALGLLASPAFADAIDGNWCHSDGRRFSIRGPEIVTPGGKRMEGSHSRHWVSYMAPADENTVHLRLGEQTSTLETWVRCSPSVSLLVVLPQS